MKTVQSRISTTLTVLLGAVLCHTAAHGQPAKAEQAIKELNILRSIFNAAFEEGQERRQRLGGAETLYLAGQGMVLTFHLPGGGGGFFNGMPMPAAPPMPDLAKLNEKLAALNDANFDFDFDFDFQYTGDDESNEAYRDQLSMLQEALQEKQSDMRDIQQQLRTLQRKSREQPDEKVDAEEKQLNEQLAAVSKDIATATTAITAFRANYDQQRAAVWQQQRQEYTSLIFGTLCTYGATLRSLASDEHVNLVLRNYDEGKSQVFVLSQSDVVGCQSGEQLQQQALSYAQ